MPKKDGSMHDDKRIPAFTNYEDMAEFWDTHSLADYWDQTEPADFEIHARGSASGPRGR